MRALPCCGDMIVLPGGCRLNSPRSLELRSGDIAILFAANRAELEELLAAREVFEGFRIVLVVPDCLPETLHLAGPLNPRYTATVLHSIEELSAVLHKMQLGWQSPACRFAPATDDPGDGQGQSEQA
ncbi:MAG: hypothetical protein BWK76_19970 [Desulfobulbaceae bacterium A2]|nr:MAG: hypothetical protein BWK76_19970 [Desulfobulbaceae bacterium A2]